MPPPVAAQRCGFWPSTISWPQAARMSRPRLLRTDTVMSFVGEDAGEGVDTRVRRPLERNARRGVERNQVDLGLDARQQLRQPARILRRIVDAVEHHVLERDAAALLQREPAAGVEDVVQRILLGRRHDRARAAPRWWRAARSRGWASAPPAPACRASAPGRPSTASPAAARPPSPCSSFRMRSAFIVAS